MSTISIPQFVPGQLQALQTVRNGKSPDAGVQSRLAGMLNQAASWRTKEVFRYGSKISSISTSAGVGPTTRWRFSWNAGPYVRYLLARAVVALRNDDTAPGSSYANLQIKNGAGTTIGNAVFSYGDTTSSPTDMPNEWGVVSSLLRSAGGTPVTMTASTAYYGEVTDNNDARIISISIWEVSLAADTDNGYAEQGFTSLGPVYDLDRQTPATIARSMWTDGAGHLTNVTADIDSAAIVNSTTTAKNVLDTAITTVSSSTPGFTLDLTYKSTIGRSAGVDVPVTLRVYAARTVSNGTIKLKDSSGTTVLTVSVTGTAAWYEVSGNLPATTSKYDLHLTAGAAGTITFYAASLLQLA